MLTGGRPAYFFISVVVSCRFPFSFFVAVVVDGEQWGVSGGAVICVACLRYFRVGEVETSKCNAIIVWSSLERFFLLALLDNLVRSKMLCDESVLLLWQ
jgi:hypothetical protein